MSATLLLLLLIVVQFQSIFSQPCTFTDNRGSGLQLDLRGLDGKPVLGSTSLFNYSYTPCENDLKCSFGPNRVDAMAIQYNDTYCNYLAEMEGSQPYWDPFVESWTFSGYGNGGPGVGDFRMNIICNKSVETYNTLFFGAMGDGQFGVTFETQYGCPVNHTIEFERDFIDDSVTATPCTSNVDCSYNGECKNKVCECDPAWKGQYCAQLNLQPTTKDAGYQNFEGGQNVSSWGGSVIKGSDNKYHMYAAEMGYWCGISTWRPNSLLIHAVSDTYNGKYVKTAEIGQIWTHEPTACRAPTGEYVVYAVHYPGTVAPCQGCENGKTLDCDYELMYAPPEPKTYTQMKYTSVANGSTGYSDWTIIPTQNPDGQDSCLACYIYPNGSLIALFEGDFDDGEDIWVEYAENWKDNSTYKFYHAKIPTGLIVEDPYIWQDKNGILHAIFHNEGWDTPFGYHMWSTNDGREWNGYDQSITAYDDIVYYMDDNGQVTSSAQFQRCERPHIIMDDDGYTPIALTNSAQLGGEYLDYSYTLLRPINTDKNNAIKYKTRDFSKAKKKNKVNIQ